MRVLAIDTSHPRGAAAVARDGQVVGSVTFGDQKGHLVELGTAVDALVREAGLRIGDIDRVAVVWGPGSFTGLRIGMAYVKGLYAGSGAEIVAVGTLELLAAGGLERHGRVCAMIDARKDEVYAALFEASGAGPERVAVPRTLIDACAAGPKRYLETLEQTPTLFLGTGAARYRALIEAALGKNAAFAGAAYDLPSAPILCRMAEVVAPLTADEVLALEPRYIRPSGARLKPLKPIRTHD